MKYCQGIITNNWVILILIIVKGVFLIPVLTNAQLQIPDSNCLECHSDIDKLSEFTADYTTLLVPADFNDISSHKDLGCVGCHADPGGYPHPEVMAIIQCSECHSAENADYIKSPHGAQSAASIQLIPKCWDCHALHPMRSSSDPLSKVHKNNEWKTCTECHTTDAEGGDIKFSRGIHSYKINQNKENNSLTCRDCHGFHLLSPEYGTEWKGNFTSENEFCGECHTTEFGSFNLSVHSTAVINTVSGDVKLNCSDCHIEHIFNNTTFLREEASTALITDNCVECHSPVNITSQFAQNARGYTEKIDSFHGIKNLHGNLIFQNCSSCHGIHEINSFAGKEGNIISSEISNNCGQCHPNAIENFSASLVHLSEGVEREDDIKIARLLMIILVYSTLSVVLISIIGDVYKEFRRRS